MNFLSTQLEEMSTINTWTTKSFEVEKFTGEEKKKGFLDRLCVKSQTSKLRDYFMWRIVYGEELVS